MATKFVQTVGGVENILKQIVAFLDNYKLQRNECILNYELFKFNVSECYINFNSLVIRILFFKISDFLPSTSA